MKTPKEKLRKEILKELGYNYFLIKKKINLQESKMKDKIYKMFQDSKFN